MSARGLPPGAPVSRQLRHQRANRAAGACRAAASHGPAVKGGRCAACYLKCNPDPGAPRRATARDLVGLAVVAVAHNPRREYDPATGRAGPRLYSPAVTLSDGSVLTFEPQRGGGVRMLWTRPPPRPGRRKGDA